MAALTQDRKYRKMGSGARAFDAKLAANAIPHQGGLVSASATGYAKASSNTAGERVIGFCTAGADNTGGADGALSIPVESDCILLLDNDGVHPVTQADLFHLCFVKDDHTVMDGAGGGTVIAGIPLKIDVSGGVWVWLSEDLGHASVVRAAPEAVAATAALSTTVGSSLDTTAAAHADTLADGAYEGQQKWIRLKTFGAGHNAVITPAHFADGATITLSAAGQFWLGEWHSDGWHTVATTGAIA